MTTINKNISSKLILKNEILIRSTMKISFYELLQVFTKKIKKKM
jgi:hypothetical protein